jgi:hypothetical protein
MVNRASVRILESELENALSEYVRDVHLYSGDKIMCRPIVDGYVQPSVQLLIQLRAVRIPSVELHDLVVEFEIRCNIVNKSDLIDALGGESKCESLFSNIESTVIRSKVQFSNEVVVEEIINIGGNQYVRRR